MTGKHGVFSSFFIGGRREAETHPLSRERQKGIKKVTYLLADFSSLHDVVHMALAFGEIQNHLDVLINNAGVFPMEREDRDRHLSVQEYDLCFSVNYLAPFLLTHLLLPALRAAPSARIVNVTSAAQQAYDKEARRLLWRISMKLTDLKQRPIEPSPPA